MFCEPYRAARDIELSRTATKNAIKTINGATGAARPEQLGPVPNWLNATLAEVGQVKV